MSENQKLRLPYDGYDNIKKILYSYYLSGTGPAALDDVANRAGMHRTVVSRNSGFLIDAGLLTGGNKKQLTEQGRKLAACISNGLEEDEAHEWRSAIRNSSTIAPIVDMIRIRQEIPVDELGRRIASTLKETYSGRSKTGYSTLIEILQRAWICWLWMRNYKLSSVTATGDGQPIKVWGRAAAIFSLGRHQ